MCAAKRNRALAPALLALRPALTEARLMTEKHACDENYVATLAEELRRIESKIAAAEEVLHLPQNSALNHTGEQAPGGRVGLAFAPDRAVREQRRPKKGRPPRTPCQHCVRLTALTRPAP